MKIEIKNHRIVEPMNKAEVDVIYPVKDGFYENEEKVIMCVFCGLTIPDIGTFPENWVWGETADICPNCTDWKGVPLFVPIARQQFP